jgi:hypothetical protein
VQLTFFGMIEANLWSADILVRLCATSWQKRSKRSKKRKRVYAGHDESSAQRAQRLVREKRAPRADRNVRAPESVGQGFRRVELPKRAISGNPGGSAQTWYSKALSGPMARPSRVNIL